MIFHTLFQNNFELIIPEFFLTTMLLILLLFGVFYKTNQNQQKLLIFKNITTIIIYLLLILLLLTFNIPVQSITLFNGVLIINSFTQFIKIILITLTLICFSIQKKYVIQQKINSYEINILFLIALLGLMILISSNNLIAFYLAIELQSLSFYILTATQKKSIYSIEAGLKYFILGSIASGFILFGSSILYALTGSLNFNQIFLILSNLNFLDQHSLLVSFAYSIIFIVVGLLFKLGAVPFHFWLPDVYEGAPNNVSSFFAIVPKIAFIGILIRLFFDFFMPISYFFELFFYLISFFSMIIGSLSALQQKKIKRFLAYSSISHIGFILIGFTANIYNNIPFILFYILIYSITSINLWTLYLSLKINHKPIKYLTDLSNLALINQLFAGIFIINMFSLAGIPPLAGFFSKFFIFLSAIKNNYFSLIFGSIIISILSSFYYLKIVKILYFETLVRKIYFSQINKISSIILLITTQIILFLFLFPNIILLNLTKIYLYFLI